MSEVVLELQSELREALKEPFGPIATDTSAVLAAAGSPLITVGDIVTYHVLEAGRIPDVALVDERTKRAAVDDEVIDVLDAAAFDGTVHVENPAATLTTDLLAALRDALASDETTIIRVDGEEDLAALPAIAAVPYSGSVLYGQPDEGVVHVAVDAEVRERVVDILDRMEGDTAAVWSTLGIDR